MGSALAHCGEKRAGLNLATNICMCVCSTPQLWWGAQQKHRLNLASSAGSLGSASEIGKQRGRQVRMGCFVNVHNEGISVSGRAGDDGRLRKMVWVWCPSNLPLLKKSKDESGCWNTYTCLGYMFSLLLELLLTPMKCYNEVKHSKKAFND